MEYRQIDLSAWKQVGEGGLGKTYENPDNPRELLKHNKAQMDDLGWFSHGDPYFDLGHLSLLCFFYSRFPQTQEIFHIGEEQFHAFWDAFAVAYTGEKDHSAFDARAGKFAPFDIIIRNYFIPSTPDYSGLFAQLIHALVEKYY